MFPHRVHEDTKVSVNQTIREQLLQQRAPGGGDIYSLGNGGITTTSTRRWCHLFIREQWYYNNEHQEVVISIH